MKYDILKIKNTKIEKGDFKNFEKICCSFFNEDEKYFKELKTYEKTKNNIEVAFKKKIIDFMMSLSNDHNVYSDYQFQIFNINDFEAFHKLYPSEESLDLIEMKGDYTNTYNFKGFEDLFIFNSSGIKTIFKEFNNFTVNKDNIKLEDLNKDMFLPEKNLKESNLVDDVFVVLKNGIFFKKSNSAYLFYNDGIIYKNFNTKEKLMRLNNVWHDFN